MNAAKIQTSENNATVTSRARHGASQQAAIYTELINAKTRTKNTKLKEIDNSDSLSMDTRNTTVDGIYLDNENTNNKESVKGLIRQLIDKTEILFTKVTSFEKAQIQSKTELNDKIKQINDKLADLDKQLSTSIKNQADNLLHINEQVREIRSEQDKRFNAQHSKLQSIADKIKELRIQKFETQDLSRGNVRASWNTEEKGEITKPISKKLTTDANEDKRTTSTSTEQHGFENIMATFDGQKTGESLESFIDRVVNPDASFTSQCKEAIHTVAELMRSKSVDHKVATTVKGGSLGKGTAVRGRSDADLLFIYADISSVETLRAKLDELLRELQSALARSQHQIKSIKRTPFTIQFEIVIGGVVSDVDVLPIIKLDIDNPTKEKLSPIYQQMKAREDLRDYYGKCLAPLQVSFVSQRTEKLKRAIRLLKYWVKTRKHVLKSYGAELLVIKTYEELGSPEVGGMKTVALMKAVFEKLSNLKTLKVSWNTYYKPSSYYLPDPPYILDPAFPYHNLTKQKSGSIDEKYIFLERDAKKFLASVL